MIGGRWGSGWGSGGRLLVPGILSCVSSNGSVRRSLSLSPSLSPQSLLLPRAYTTSRHAPIQPARRPNSTEHLPILQRQPTSSPRPRRPSSKLLTRSAINSPSNHTLAATHGSPRSPRATTRVTMGRGKGGGAEADKGGPLRGGSSQNRH